MICVSIFAVILRYVNEKKPAGLVLNSVLLKECLRQYQPADAIKSLTALIGTVLGGGLAEYAVFGRILSTDPALAYVLLSWARDRFPADRLIRIA